MSRVNNKLILVSVIICSMFGITSCSQGPFKKGMQGGVPVESVIIEEMPVSQSGIYQAKLISRHSVSIRPQISGNIFDIFVKPGDSVKAGQTLMSIDKRKQEAALNSSQAEAEAAKAVLNNYQVQREALQSNLELNKQLFERYTALYEKKSVSKQDLEKYTDSYNKAKADLNANTAQIAAQKAVIEKNLYSIKEKEVELDYYRIVAPYSGIIGDIPVKIGDYVTTTTSLLNITQNNFLEVNVGLPVEKVFDIKKGLPIEVLDNNNKVVCSSKISFVAPNVDTSTQTVLVKAIVPNKSGVLKADQSVKVRVVFNEAPGILVPASAISHFGGQDFAYVIKEKDNQAFVKQLPVKLGEIQNNKYVVISGITAGDKIVSQGIQKLMDGAPVTIIPIKKEGAQ